MDDYIKKELEETAKLKRQMLELGITLPNNGALWWRDTLSDINSDSIEEMVTATTSLLTQEGKVTAKRLINAEKRKNAEWWIKVVGSIITLVTGLLGSLIGVLAFLKK